MRTAWRKPFAPGSRLRAMSGTSPAASSAGERKVHNSALCFVPPASLWRQLQLARCFHDKSFVRWPPHINLLYPFVEDQGEDQGGSFAAAAEAAAGALADVEPFQASGAGRPGVTPWV